jgi:hypothetical protein
LLVEKVHSFPLPAHDRTRHSHHRRHIEPHRLMVC